MKNTKSKKAILLKERPQREKKTAKPFPLVDGKTPEKGSLEPSKGGKKYAGSFQPNS